MIVVLSFSLWRWRQRWWWLSFIDSTVCFTIVVFGTVTRKIMGTSIIDGTVLGRAQRFWLMTESKKEGNKGKEKKNRYTSIPFILLFRGEEEHFSYYTWRRRNRRRNRKRSLSTAIVDDRNVDIIDINIICRMRLDWIRFIIMIDTFTWLRKWTRIGIVGYLGCWAGCWIG